MRASGLVFAVFCSAACVATRPEVDLQARRCRGGESVPREPVLHCPEAQLDLLCGDPWAPPDSPILCRGAGDELRPLASFTPEEVTGLHIAGAQLQDLDRIRSWRCLRFLTLSGTSVRDLSLLAELPALRALTLDWNEVRDLSTLRGASGIRGLHLIYEPVADLTPLVSLPHLEELVLNTTRVSDLSPLHELCRLRSLSIHNSPIADLSPLVRLGGLSRLSLGRTAAPEAMVEQLREQLTGREVELRVVDYGDLHDRPPSAERPPLSEADEARLIWVVHQGRKEQFSEPETEQRLGIVAGEASVPVWRRHDADVERFQVTYESCDPGPRFFMRRDGAPIARQDSTLLAALRAHPEVLLAGVAVGYKMFELLVSNHLTVIPPETMSQVERDARITEVAPKANLTCHSYKLCTLELPPGTGLGALDTLRALTERGFQAEPAGWPRLCYD